MVAQEMVYLRVCVVCVRVCVCEGVFACVCLLACVCAHEQERASVSANVFVQFCVCA